MLEVRTERTPEECGGGAGREALDGPESSSFNLGLTLCEKLIELYT